MPFIALILDSIHPGTATAVRELGALGEVRTYLTTPESLGSEQVAQALSEGAGSMVVAGEDGMQRLVAGALTGTGVLLGTLATGIACVYSRNLGLPRGLTDAAPAMTGVPHSMGLGWTSFDGGSPEPSLVAAGMGRDVEILLGVRSNLKKRLGRTVYVRAGFGAIGRRRLPLRASGQPIEAWTALAGNIGRASTTSLFPGAHPDDERLHVIHLGIDG